MSEVFEYFWQSGSPYSQWYKRNFVVKDVTYNCCEQYMMHQKALFFHDFETAERIMEVTEPRDQKALGRAVKNFNKKAWDVKSLEVVYDGNYAKFTQNPDLLKKLLETKGKTLVEASPYDEIWGIKLSKDDPRAKSRSTWLGKNHLGEILTRLREDLLKEKS